MSLIQVSFVFNKETDEISDLKVSKTTSKEGDLKALKAEKKAIKGAIESAKLDGNTLRLTTDILTALKGAYGDKFTVESSKLSPGLIVTKVDKGGIALTKTNTLNVKKLVSEFSESTVNELTGDLSFRALGGGKVLLSVRNDNVEDTNLEGDDAVTALDTVTEDEIESLVKEDLGDNLNDFDFNFDF